MILISGIIRKCFFFFYCILAQLQGRNLFQSQNSHQSASSSTAIWLTAEHWKIWWTWQAASPAPNTPLKSASATATRTSFVVLLVLCQTQSSLGCQINLVLSIVSVHLWDYSHKDRERLQKKTLISSWQNRNYSVDVCSPPNPDPSYTIK